jgi:hypothetical protein
MVKNMKKYNPKLSRLGFFEEAVGVLHEIVEDEGMLIARISKIVFAFPLEMEDRLMPFLGQRIGILRTDIPHKEYLVRALDEIAPIRYDVRLNADLPEAAMA